MIYKKPTDPLVTGIFQKDDTHYSFDHQSKKGFVFAPFDQKEKKLIIPNKASEQFQTHWDSTNQIQKKTRQSLPDSSEMQRYINFVSKTIDYINQSEVKKIVISRKEVITLREFNMVESFGNMLKKYPNAMNYCWFHPISGLWMGATPEPLISLKNTCLNTVSLAATKPYKGTLKVAWNEKEFEEQQMVTDFILDELQPFSFGLTATNPKTYKAGNLLHLCSEICGKIMEKTSVFQLIDALHPTPAVCGFPRKITLDFLKQYENYDREFYTGYLGEFDSNKETHLYVNLRCIKVNRNSASIYIGGGITSKSQPDCEWEETALKAMTMKEVILSR